MLTIIPFSGFYNSLHDSSLDDALDQENPSAEVRSRRPLRAALSARPAQTAQRGEA